MARTRVKMEWNGDEIQKRIQRAHGRAIISGAEQVASHAKGFVHVITGDLRRSIHAAKVHTMGQIDPTVGNVTDGLDAQVEVGSWLAYACVEETGRGHTYMAPAMELVTGTFKRTVQAAYQAEGLDAPR